MKAMISESELLSKFVEHDLYASDVEIERLDVDAGGANWRARLISEVSNQARLCFVYIYARLHRDYDLLPVD